MDNEQDYVTRLEEQLERVTLELDAVKAYRDTLFYKLLDREEQILRIRGIIGEDVDPIRKNNDERFRQAIAENFANGIHEDGN